LDVVAAPWAECLLDRDQRAVLQELRPDLLVTGLLGNPWTWAFAFTFFFIFMVLIIAGMSNFVNLTDGLDGLAIGLMIIASARLQCWRTSAAMPNWRGMSRSCGYPALRS
jgi:UDP-N-acetylmuramyl pentapeptide phosphotransferase/UDP-N-acetylglucosamine-1-phosphate transferase